MKIYLPSFNFSKGKGKDKYVKIFKIYFNYIYFKNYFIIIKLKEMEIKIYIV